MSYSSGGAAATNCSITVSPGLEYFTPKRRTSAVNSSLFSPPGRVRLSFCVPSCGDHSLTMLTMTQVTAPCVSQTTSLTAPSCISSTTTGFFVSLILFSRLDCVVFHAPCNERRIARLQRRHGGGMFQHPRLDCLARC